MSCNNKISNHRQWEKSLAQITGVNMLENWMDIHPILHRYYFAWYHQVFELLVVKPFSWTLQRWIFACKTWSSMLDKQLLLLKVKIKKIKKIKVTIRDHLWLSINNILRLGASSYHCQGKACLVMNSWTKMRPWYHSIISWLMISCLFSWKSMLETDTCRP